MLTAMNLTKTVEYQSPRDPDFGTDAATKFKVGAIPARIQMALKDQAASFITDASAEGGMRTDFRPNTAALDNVRFGLKGFTNYCDDEGQEIEFKTVKYRFNGQFYDVVHEDVLAKIDPETLRELSAKITELSELTVQAAKNSAG